MAWIIFVLAIAASAYLVYRYIPEEGGTDNATWIGVGGFIGAVILIVLIGYIPITTWTCWLQNGKGLVATLLSAIFGWLGIQSFRSGTFVNFTTLQNLYPPQGQIAKMEEQQKEAETEFVGHLAQLDAALGANPTAVADVRNLLQQLDNRLHEWEQNAAAWVTRAHNLGRTTMEGLAQAAQNLANAHRGVLATQSGHLAGTPAAGMIATAIGEMRRIIREEQQQADRILNEAGASISNHRQPIAGSIALVLAFISLIFGGAWTTQSPPTPPKTHFEQLADASKHCPDLLVVDIQATQTLIELRQFKDDSAEKWKKIAEENLKNPKVLIDKVVAVRMVSEDRKTIAQYVIFFDGRLFTDDPNVVKEAKLIEPFKGAKVHAHRPLSEAKTNAWIERTIKICNPLAPINVVGGAKGGPELEPPEIPGM